VNETAEANPDSRFWPRLSVALATGGGVGLSPIAPGTVGSLVGLLPAWAVGQMRSPLWATFIVPAVCAVGVPIVHAALPRLRRGKDPGCIVLDEITGIMITFLLVPMSSIFTAAAGFALFRLFDISKPPPCRRAERLAGGLGVMADDWIAGIYANAALRLLLALGLPN
jgi:phosphatidylglycerophosphatase A